MRATKHWNWVVDLKALTSQPWTCFMPTDLILPVGLFPPTPTPYQETNGLWEQEGCKVSVCSKQILIQIRQQQGHARASAVLLCPSCSVWRGCWAEFQDFWRVTWPGDSGINQDHKTKEKCVLWGVGWRVEHSGNFPPTPTYACLCPPFDLKFQPGPLRLRILHSKGFGWGSPTCHTPTPTLFFNLKILICVIQSLIDSSWLLGMCFVVMDQHPV